MIYNIPGQEMFELRTLILDLNGTLTIGGQLVKGVKKRLSRLQALGFDILFFTGNTRNDADKFASNLNIRWVLADTAEAKAAEARKLGPNTCAAIGNGLIDCQLMKTVKLRIVTLQAEGIHLQTMLNSDIIVPSINDALDLLIDPARLVATLRR